MTSGAMPACTNASDVLNEYAAQGDGLVERWCVWCITRNSRG